MFSMALLACRSCCVSWVPLCAGACERSAVSFTSSLTVSMKCSVPDKGDILVMQPTSIGGGVDNKYMCKHHSSIAWRYDLYSQLFTTVGIISAELLRAYLPEDYWDSGEGCSQTEGRRMDALRLLWPEAPFMLLSEESIHVDSRRTRHNCDPDDTDSDNERDGKKRGTEAHDDDNQLVFLLPKTLALMEPDLQSQMHVYRAYPWMHQLPPVTSSSSSPRLKMHGNDTHSPLCQATPLSRQIVPSGVAQVDNTAPSECSRPPPPPHIKSYARLLRSNGDSECTCSDLAWFLLTSACLSKGLFNSPSPPLICS